MILRTLILLFGLVLLPGAASAASQKAHTNQFLVDSWQTPQGLPENLIDCILQTRDGYLWVGTYGGLARFDGTRFVTFGVYNSQGFRHNRIRALHEGPQGDLWIGSDGGGLTRYHDNHFTNFGIQDGLLSDTIYWIGGDPSGAIWLQTLKGLNRWQNEKIIAVPPEKSPWDLKSIWSFKTTPSGQVWLARSNAQEYLLPQKLSSLGNFSEAWEDPGNHIWVYGRRCLARLPSNSRSDLFTAEDPLFEGDLSCVLQAKNGDVWVGTSDKGLFYWQPGQGANFQNVPGISDAQIRCIYEDREGVVWVGTTSGGLNRIRPRHLAIYSEDAGLLGKDILSVAEDSSRRLWVGTFRSGLFYSDLDASQNCRFNSIQGSFGDYGIWSLCPVRNGQLWVGTWGFGLYQLKGGIFTRYTSREGLSDNDVQALYEDRDGTLWIGSHQGGLDCLQGTNFTTFGPKQGLTATYITSILRARDGSLWVGSNGGGAFRMAQGRFTGFSIKDGLSSSIVLVLHEDSEGRLWLGTQGDGGLSLWDGRRFINFTRSMGLPADAVKQILEDDAGSLWLGSNCGIIRVSKQELTQLAEGATTWLHAMSYGQTDGLLNVECRGGTQPAAWKTHDGKLWFATHEGLVTIDPRKIYAHATPPPVIIEEVLAAGQRTKPFTHHSPSESAIKLSPGQRSLQIRYTALDLAMPEKVQFKYRLEGLDKEWIEAGERRIALYQQLPPGDYRFHVTACGDNGVFNDAGASLTITCLPSFWETRWFLALAILSAFGAIAAAVRLITQRRMLWKLERLERQRALEQERTRIARDIHDEIGSSLTKINKLATILDQQAAVVGVPNPSVRNIADTAHKTIQAMDEIVWAVNPKNDSLDEMASYIGNFATEFLRANAIIPDIQVPLTLPDIPVSAELRHNLLMVVKEALNNAVKHAQPNKIYLCLTLRQDLLTIKVKDNGSGFDPRVNVSSGNGLEIMRRRLATINGQLDVESAPACGTVVRMTVKLVPAPSKLAGTPME